MSFLKAQTYHKELILEIRPNFGSQIELPTLEIDQILPNYQLEHIERMEKHTKFKENGGRKCANELHEIPSKTVQTACFVAVSGDHDGRSRLRWARTGRGKYMVLTGLVFLQLVAGVERYHLWKSAGRTAKLQKIWVFKN
ncbi:hypothetical protein L3X38_003932 [Prunus dulcis]|uniref:Uncharacterized protein n=1 Tax=Prunus dulcis TaxID=3755 RepID=A0AAD4ZN23_PRUDU|nr:hypothetical protein L3X38_003932 [Prunus dulcis]